MDNYMNSIISFTKNLIKSFSAILGAIIGIVFIIIIIVIWLGFFGIIPHGSPPDDGHGGRYTNEMYDSFR